MSESNNKITSVAISVEDLEETRRILGDACEVIRSKYPSANHLERKGMKLMMEELTRAEAVCIEILRSAFSTEQATEPEEADSSVARPFGQSLS